MITIRTLFSQFSFDNKKEYAIYETAYPADKYGRPLDEEKDAETIKNGHFYEYGSIIVKTPQAKYELSGIYSAYEWVTELLDYINAHKREENIFVDMNMLIRDSEDGYREFDGFFKAEHTD